MKKSKGDGAITEDLVVADFSADGFIFDLDGTVYLGEEVLPGAIQGIAELRSRGKRVLFVSNKPLEPRNAYAAKLTGLGIPTEEDDIITSAYVLGRHLADTNPALNLYVIGELALIEELRGHGLQVVEGPEQDPKGVIDAGSIDAVVVAFDRTLDYRKLNTAYQALRQGARFFATNADKTCPMPGGAIPDAGATIAALEHISGRTVELVAGKPSSLMLAVALERLGLPAANCIMVGDRLETDIRMGQEAGMVTAVVLTGVIGREDLAEAAIQPDLVLENVGELPGLVV
ncbi:MAG: HAD-IIA family hydrolase [Proteobacteria bacterium]|nr:HAD-IIA family hydrolase [Pseudomonadota bacterium]